MLHSTSSHQNATGVQEVIQVKQNALPLPAGRTASKQGLNVTTLCEDRTLNTSSAKKTDFWIPTQNLKMELTVGTKRTPDH